ncbi:MAG: BACON domain-containing protein [Candidatus Cryptobacteroides sp.]
MKKTIFSLAVLAALASCARTESYVPVAESADIQLTINAKTPATKAEFNGTDAIDWNEMDAIHLAIATAENPTQAIKISGSSGGYANYYLANFTLQDNTAKVPQFKGYFYSLNASYINTERDFYFHLYGAYPNSLNRSNADITESSFTLSSAQKSKQTTWDKSCDLMLAKPSKLYFSKTSHSVTTYKEYDITAQESLEFAHVFGFGCLQFADAAEKYASADVLSVTVEATGEKKDIAGTFEFDLTKKVNDADFTLQNTSAASTIKITPAEAVTLNDAVIYFVANPGEYDVTITVETSKGNLIYERKGLVIERAQIARPTVHFKADVDQATTNAVDLAGGKTWEHNSVTGGNGMALNATTYKAKWGTTAEKQMLFQASYENVTTSWGSIAPTYNSSYGQSLINNHRVDATSVITLESGDEFLNVENIRIRTFLGSDAMTADFKVSLTDENGEHQLTEVNYKSSISNSQADLCYKMPEGVTGGVLKMEWSNFSVAKYTNVYVPYIILNSGPILSLGTTDLGKVAAAGAGGTVSVSASLASGDPTVETSAEWITASYASGSISFSVAANKGDARTGSITVKVKGLNDMEATQVIKLSQAAGNVVEYKVRADAAVIHDALVAKAGESATSNTLVSFDVTLTAVATDGTGATVEVPATFTNVYFNNIGTSIACKFQSPYTQIAFNLPGAYKQAVMESTVKRFGNGINLNAGVSSSSNKGVSTNSTFETTSTNFIKSTTPAQDPSLGYTYAIVKCSGYYTGSDPVNINYLDIIFEASK